MRCLPILFHYLLVHCLLILLLAVSVPMSARVIKSDRFTLIGTSKYSPDFEHFDYVNPNAPKGGLLRLAGTSSFDSLNNFSEKGIAPPYLYDIHGKLMVRSADEPYSQYALIAQWIEYPEDFSWVIFHINPAARFSDNHPIRSDDLVFTLNRLKEQGSPFFRNLYKYYQAEALTPLTVRFTSPNKNPKFIAIAGFMPVLPRHFWESRPFSEKLTAFPVCSGPLKVTRFNKKQSITYERIEDYWGAELPVNRGRFNFDQIRVDVYKDAHASLEAFKAGLYDLRHESDINHWHTAYDSPALRNGKIQKRSIRLLYPPGMSGLVFNTRRTALNNPNVREALTLAFDFEWLNQKLLHSAYQRSTSYFIHTRLQASGMPSKAELQLLAPFRDSLPASVFGLAPQPPVSPGNGSNRKHHRKALRLFKQAGWQIKNSRMINIDSGESLTLTLIFDDRSQERLLIPYRKSLKGLGIELELQVMDQSLFRKRIQQFDFDLANWHYWQSMYPGHELLNAYSSEAAKTPGSANIAGIQEPAVDFLLERLMSARNYEEMVPIGRALDRILLSGHYLIPKWYTQTLHYAYWRHIRPPDAKGLHWISHHDWWYQSKPESEQP